MHKQAFTSFLKNWDIACKCPSLFFQLDTFSIVVHPDKPKPHQKMLRRWNENDKDDVMFQLLLLSLDVIAASILIQYILSYIYVTEPYHVFFILSLLGKSQKWNFGETMIVVADDGTVVR